MTWELERLCISTFRFCHPNSLAKQFIILINRGISVVRFRFNFPFTRYYFFTQTLEYRSERKGLTKSNKLMLNQFSLNSAMNTLWFMLFSINSCLFKHLLHRIAKFYEFVIYSTKVNKHLRSSSTKNAL